MYIELYIWKTSFGAQKHTKKMNVCPLLSAEILKFAMHEAYNSSESNEVLIYLMKMRAAKYCSITDIILQAQNCFL